MPNNSQSDLQTLAQETQKAYPFADVTVHDRDSKGQLHQYPFIAVAYNGLTVLTVNDLADLDATLSFVEAYAKERLAR